LSEDLFFRSHLYFSEFPKEFFQFFSIFRFFSIFHNFQFFLNYFSEFFKLFFPNFSNYFFRIFSYFSQVFGKTYLQSVFPNVFYFSEFCLKKSKDPGSCDPVFLRLCTRGVIFVTEDRGQIWVRYGLKLISWAESSLNQEIWQDADINVILLSCYCPDTVILTEYCSTDFLSPSLRWSWKFCHRGERQFLWPFRRKASKIIFYSCLIFFS